MNLVFNAIFAILAYLVVAWLAGELGVERRVAVILGVLAAILVFLANLAVRVV